MVRVSAERLPQSFLFCKGADVVLYDGNEKLDAGRIKDEILQEAQGRAPEKRTEQSVWCLEISRRRCSGSWI